MSKNETFHREREMNSRVLDMLISSFGPVIQSHIMDPEVIEIMLNSDGRLWVDKLCTGREYTGHDLTHADAERIIRIVSSKAETLCNADNPIISAELPGSGARFQGILPPVVTRPVFTIRKKALVVYTLDDYVKQGVMSKDAADFLKKAVAEKKNILVAGGTGSGKTTLANAILEEISKYEDRIIIIEDTLELQCKVKDSVTLRTCDVADITSLLKATMRMRPDRIIVGEVRGGEALGLLKAWNTGHPGGLSTVHANDAKGSLTRIESLVQEAITIVPRTLIAAAINVIVFIRRVGTARRVESIATVEEYQDEEYVLSYLENVYPEST